MIESVAPVNVLISKTGSTNHHRGCDADGVFSPSFKRTIVVLVSGSYNVTDDRYEAGNAFDRGDRAGRET